MHSITKDSKVDNFLLEMELALQHAEHKRMAILPILVGHMSNTDPPTFVRFSAYSTQRFPAIPSPSCSRGTVRSTVDRLFRRNGLKLLSRFPTDDDIDEVVKVLEHAAWLPTKDSLQVSQRKR